MEIRACDMVDAVGEFPAKMPNELLPLPRSSIEATVNAFDKVELNTVEPKSTKISRPKQEATESPKIPPKPNSTNGETPPAATSGKVAPMAKTMAKARPIVKPDYKPSVVPLTDNQRVFITHVVDHRTLYVHPHGQYSEWQESCDRLQRLWTKCEPLNKEPEAGHVLLGELKDEGGFARVVVQKVRSEHQKARVEFMVSSFFLLLIFGGSLEMYCYLWYENI